MTWHVNSAVITGSILDSSLYIIILGRQTDRIINTSSVRSKEFHWIHIIDIYPDWVSFKKKSINEKLFGRCPVWCVPLFVEMIIMFVYFEYIYTYLHYVYLIVKDCVCTKAFRDGKLYRTNNSCSSNSVISVISIYMLNELTICLS